MCIFRRIRRTSPSNTDRALYIVAAAALPACATHWMRWASQRSRSKTMCAYSVSVSTRALQGGTDEGVLLKHAAKKYGFTYRTTSKNAELLAHLKSGGVAILHGGSSHKLFSNSGHFVCAVRASGETITVLDSYWYAGKYTSTKLRRQKVKVLAKGVITTSLYQCGLATADRAPSYYLISKAIQKPQKPGKQQYNNRQKAGG